MIESKEYKFVRDVLPTNIERDDILNITARDVNPYTHGFHKYPAKFIPQIPKWAITKYLNGDNNKYVLDPFCGSGTTLVESVLAGYNAIGIDIDPLSVLISKVKTTKIDEKQLKNISDWLINEIKGNRESVYIPESETIEHWFTKDAIKKLSKIRTIIDVIPEKFDSSKKSKDIQDLFYVCFSSIIRRVSNADNESQKTYVSHTKLKEPEEVISLFFSQLELYIERVKVFSKEIDDNAECKTIITSSANSLDKILENQQIDLIITSPPYIKAIDYIYNQMVELFWIGDLFDMQTQSKQNKKKLQYIGNKQIPKAEFTNYSPYNTILDIESLDKKLQEVYDTDKKNGHKHSYITYKYFREMENHFTEINKYISNNAHYIMVVGDSTVSNIYFNTADFLIKLAERNGFKTSNKWGYKIKNRYMRFNRKGRGGIIEIDWVLDLQKK